MQAALGVSQIAKLPHFIERRKYRVIGSLPNTDYVMTHVFWIGVYPGLTKEMLDFVAATIFECAAAARPVSVRS
jgi:dTDP-4-amino-4,6-dideoxygalactose transaminase